MTVRQGRTEDLPALLFMERACFSHPFTEAAVRSHLTEGWGYALLAEEAGEPCGYLLGSLIAGEGEVFRVATLPAFRRKGVAEALLSALLSVCEDCFLEVRRGNLPARGLYEKLGFAPMGERQNYYTDPVEDAVLYKRQASPEK